MTDLLQQAILDYADDHLDDIAESIYESQKDDCIEAIIDGMDKGVFREAAIQAIKDIDTRDLGSARELRDALDKLYNSIGIR